MDELWDREKLYAEVWESPIIKIASGYGVSAVALGKTCRKLRIPLPGRGYWAKLAHGKSVKRPPLPDVENLPVVRRMPPSGVNASDVKLAVDDPGLEAIELLEKKDFSHFLNASQNKLVAHTAKAFVRAQVDERGVLTSKSDTPVLDIRVSKGCLERALRLINAVILSLEDQGLPVSVKPGSLTTLARVVDENVPFAVIERLRITKREVKEGSHINQVKDYFPTGILELRIGHTGYGWSKTVADGASKRAEHALAECVGKFLRYARQCRLERERLRLQHEEFERKARERGELIEEEQKKFKQLTGWVNSWHRAKRIRSFVDALEREWIERGLEVSTDSERGQRLNWMRQQADRLDPTRESPPSILDRASELGLMY
jgi:hypothetical protein